MTPNEKIQALRQLMQAEGWGAVVISGTDPHSSEYLPQRWQVRQWMMGFTGSAGTVVVTADQAGLWTDSRYFIQATAQLEGSGIELHKLGLPDVLDYPEWMAENLTENSIVCVDGLCMPLATVQSMQALFASKGISIVSRPDFIDALWSDRPSPDLLLSIPCHCNLVVDDSLNSFDVVLACRLVDGFDDLEIIRPRPLAFLFEIPEPCKTQPLLRSFVGAPIVGAPSE